MDRSSNKKRLRNVAHLWADKRVMRYLRRNYDKKVFKHLRSIYLALCEIDSDFCERKTLRNLTKTCMSYSGLSKEIVSKHMQMLRKMGLIDYAQTNKNGCYGNSELLMYVYENIAPNTDRSTENRCPVNRNPVNRPPYKNTLKSTDYKNPQESLVKNPDHRKITTSLFDEFWNIYPRKANKGYARKCWEKLCKKTDRPTWGTIRRAVKRQSKSTQWTSSNGDFIPHASTWINNYGWENDPSEMRGFSRGEAKTINISQKITDSFGEKAEMFQKHVESLPRNIKNKLSDQLLSTICDLYGHCVALQKKTAYKRFKSEIPKFGEPGYGEFCRWRDLVPNPYQIIIRYLSWLIDQRQIENFSESTFSPTGKLFMWFIEDLKKQCTCDPFTGKSIYG